MKKIITIISILLFSTTVNAERSCQELAPMIGQLMHLSVDGFGSDEIIDPFYFKMIERIQPGGILPRFAYKAKFGGLPPTYLRENDISRYNEVNSHITSLLTIPPFLARDNFYYDSGRKYSASYSMFISELAPCDLAKAHQGAFDEIGLNQIFGPIVEATLENMSLEEKNDFLRAYLDESKNKEQVNIVLKHFPYTLQSEFDLHSRSIDVPMELSEVESRYFDIYKEKGNQAGAIMTSHLFNSKVDKENLVTFSKTWVEILRNRVGFKGIIIADALDMIENFPEDEVRIKETDFGYDPSTIHKLSHYAIQSVMAGHDMFIMQTTSSESLKVHSELLEFVCQDSDQALAFRKRVEESFQRITAIKNQKGLSK